MIITNKLFFLKGWQISPTRNFVAVGKQQWEQFCKRIFIIGPLGNHICDFRLIGMTESIRGCGQTGLESDQQKEYVENKEKSDDHVFIYFVRILTHDTNIPSYGPIIKPKPRSLQSCLSWNKVPDKTIPLTGIVFYLY